MFFQSVLENYWLVVDYVAATTNPSLRFLDKWDMLWLTGTRKVSASGGRSREIRGSRFVRCGFQSICFLLFLCFFVSCAAS